MPRSAHPSDDDVREAAQQLLADHLAGGSYPSVSALARRFNINRTTFYRHYSAVTDAMLNAAAGQSASTAERRSCKTRDNEPDNIIRRLRSENSDLRCHVEIYEEQIRRLTIVNQRLRSRLELGAAVSTITDTRISPR